MTTMNGAALAVAVAEQVVLDARRGIEDSAALIYALPGQAAGAALPLFERFRRAAEAKKEDVALVQAQVLQHQQEKADKEEKEDEEQHRREMAEYHEAIQNLMKETDYLVSEGDTLLQQLEERHAKSEVLLKDNKEAVLSDDGKTILDASTGKEFADAKDAKEARERIDERLASGCGVEHWSDHHGYEQAKENHARAQDDASQAEHDAKGDDADLTAEQREVRKAALARGNSELSGSNEELRKSAEKLGATSSQNKLDSGRNTDLDKDLFEEAPKVATNTASLTSNFGKASDVNNNNQTSVTVPQPIKTTNAPAFAM